MDTLKHFIAMQDQPAQIEGALLAAFTAGAAFGTQLQDKQFDHRKICHAFDLVMNDPTIMELTKDLQH